MQDIDVEIQRPAIVVLLVHVEVRCIDRAGAEGFRIADTLAESAVHRCCRVSDVDAGRRITLAIQNRRIRRMRQSQIQRWRDLRLSASREERQGEDWAADRHGQCAGQS